MYSGVAEDGDPEVVQIPGDSLLFFQFWLIPGSKKKNQKSLSVKGFPAMHSERL